MNTEFDGKVAIVSGAASGIGRATWRLLAERGATVVATDITPPGEDMPSGSFTHQDVRDRDGWKHLVQHTADRFGGVHILVNCAGILREGSVEDTDFDIWRDVMAVNVEGTFWGCQAVLPAMRAAGGGSIVNLSSVSGLDGDADLAAYNASKGAVRLLSKEIALHCANRGLAIRCNSVHPGVVDTTMVDEFFATATTATRASWMTSQPIGRAICADEVAELIAWLASDAASYVTGSEYVIDGGLTA